MTYITHSFILSKEWKRLIVLAALTSFITMSLPVRVIAAEITNAPVAAVNQGIQTEKNASFTLPKLRKAESSVVHVPVTAATNAQVTETQFNAEQVREETSGYKVVRVMHNVPSTAYTSRPEETDDSPFIAADGTHVYDGMVAANFLKFGTKIRIPELYGDKIFEVHDRMNKRYNVKVDIWMDNLQKARQHGVRHLTIEIVEDINTEVAVK